VTDQNPPNEDQIYWNKRQKKSRVPAIVGLALLCLLLAYLLSHTAN